MHKVLIVDDELPARKKIVQFLSDMNHAFEIQEAQNANEAFVKISNHHFDFIFLDIQMPQISGIELVELLAEKKIKLPKIIFSTAHNEHAVKAFELNAVDYLLKPYDYKRFTKAVDKITKSLESNNQDSEHITKMVQNWNEQHAKSEIIWITSGRKLIPVRFTEILYFEADDNYVRVNLSDKTYLIRKKLSTILEIIDPSKFVKIHRSFVVNQDKIKELVPKSHGDMYAVLENGQQLPVSRKNRNNLLG